jgi:hypothetical protein
VIVAVPAAEHVAAVLVIVGIEGTVSCAAILKDELAVEVQLPLPTVTE